MEENKEIKNKIDLLNKKNELLEQKKNEEEKELFKGSTIIQSNDKRKLIDNWIFKNTKKITNLIYKAKKDGDKSSDFHSKYDEKIKASSSLIQEEEELVGFVQDFEVYPPNLYPVVV